MAIKLDKQDIARLKQYRDFVKKYYIHDKNHDGIIGDGITRPLTARAKLVQDKVTGTKRNDREGFTGTDVEYHHDYFIDERGRKVPISPLNGSNIFVDGALCLSTGKKGPTLAINAMMHKNEPAGLLAQMDIIERWEKGDRPKHGTIILTLGTPPDTILHYLDGIIEQAEDPKNRGKVDNDAGHYVDADHIYQLSSSLYGATHGRLLDIHSLFGDDEPMIMPYLPRNDMKRRFSLNNADMELPEQAGSASYKDRRMFTLSGMGLSDERTYTTALGATAMASHRRRVRPGHNPNEAASDLIVASAYHKSEADLVGTAHDISREIQDMPVNHILSDLYHRVLNYSINTMLLRPILESGKLEGMPMVLETGGPNLKCGHHDRAVECTRVYTHNILGWPRRELLPRRPHNQERYYYTDCLYYLRPSSLDTKDPVRINESYLLIHNKNSIPKKVRDKATDIDWNSIKPGRLKSFAYIPGGVPLAIGEESGNVIYTREGGYICSVPGERIDPEYATTTALAIICSGRIAARDMYEKPIPRLYL